MGTSVSFQGRLLGHLWVQVSRYRARCWGICGTSVSLQSRVLSTCGHKCLVTGPGAGAPVGTSVSLQARCWGICGYKCLVTGLGAGASVVQVSRYRAKYLGIFLHPACMSACRRTGCWSTLRLCRTHVDILTAGSRCKSACSGRLVCRPAQPEQFGKTVVGKIASTATILAKQDSAEERIENLPLPIVRQYRCRKPLNPQPYLPKLSRA